MSRDDRCMMLSRSHCSWKFFSAVKMRKATAQSSSLGFKAGALHHGPTQKDFNRLGAIFNGLYISINGSFP